MLVTELNNNLIDKTKNSFRLIIKEGQLTNENLTTNDILNSKTQTAYTMTSNLYLFAQNYNGSARFGGVRQIYKFLYYDKNNTLVCNLIPCYRKSDGVIGMYDTARKIFLTNIGTGSFVKGPVVQK